MQSRLLSTLLLLGLVALVSASVTPIQKRSFKVERIRNPAFTGRDGPKALAKAYRKFGMEMPANLKSVLAAREAAAAPARRSEPRQGPSRRRGLADIFGRGEGRKHHKQEEEALEKAAQQDAAVAAGAGGSGSQTGTVTNTPENNDAEFLSPVKVGGQTLNLDFDTGSSDLWVFNTQLPDNVTAGHLVYDPTKSQTFAPIQGAQFFVSYGDGSAAEGIVGTDTVDVGGAVVPNQAVELATDVTPNFAKDVNNDGLMGLAFSKLNTVKPQKQLTFFDNVKSSLALPVFTVDLRKGAPGTYEFGQIDNTKFKGQLAKVQVNATQGFWQFSSEQFAVNGGQPQPATSGGQAIDDTGTTLILADPAIVQGYYSQVDGAQDNAQAGGFTVPCDAQLPDLDLDIGGSYMARVKGEDINFSPVQGNTCFGGLQASPQGGLGIYGDIFFKSQFVVFNNDDNSLSLAEHA